MPFVYFIITPQVGLGSIHESNTKPETQMYCVKFGDTDYVAAREGRYRGLNPTFTFVSNNVGATMIGGVGVGTWLKNQIFINQQYTNVSQEGKDQSGEWYRAFNLNGKKIAHLTKGGQFAGFNFTTAAGQAAAKAALLSIFTPENTVAA